MPFLLQDSYIYRLYPKLGSWVTTLTKPIFVQSSVSSDQDGWEATEIAQLCAPLYGLQIQTLQMCRVQSENPLFKPWL